MNRKEGIYIYIYMYEININRITNTWREDES